MRVLASFSTKEFDFRPKNLPPRKEILGWWNNKSSLEDNRIKILLNVDDINDVRQIIHSEWNFEKRILYVLKIENHYVPEDEILSNWMIERIYPNKLKDTTTYLIGAMDRVSREEATGWRDDLTSKLRTMNVGVMDPCNKPFPKKEDESFKEKINNLKLEGNFDRVSDLMKTWAVRPDLRMVDKADFLVCYIDIDSHMCGSYWELCIASSQRKPILIVCKQGKAHIPNWLFGLIDHNEMFSSFEELENYLTKINNGSPTNDKWKFLDMEIIYAQKRC